MGSHMGALLGYFLSKLIRVGRLEVECADGTVRTFGNGAGPRLGVRIADRAAEWQIMFDPTLAFGELSDKVSGQQGDIGSSLAQGRERYRENI